MMKNRCSGQRFVTDCYESEKISDTTFNFFLYAAIALFALVSFGGCAPKRLDSTLLDNGRNIIKRVEAGDHEGRTRVTIEAVDSVKYTAFKLVDPLRIVVDISEADIGEIEGTISINNGTVGDLQIKQFGEDESNIGRIEISLDKMTDYEIEKDNNLLYVLIDNVIDEASDEMPLEDEAVASIEEESLAVEEEISADDVTEVADSMEEASITVENVDEGVYQKDESIEEETAVSDVPLNKAEYIADITVEDDGDQVKVIATGEGYIGDFTSFLLEDPPRVVVDILGVTNLYRKNVINVNNRILKSVRIGQHPDKMRLVIDAAEGTSPGYRADKSGNSLVITLGDDVDDDVDSEESISISADVIALADDVRSEENISISSNDATETGEEVYVKKSQVAMVSGIKFKQVPGHSIVIISVDKSVEYDLIELDEKRVAVDLKGVTIPKSLQRSLDASEFDSPINLISSYQLKRSPDNVGRVVVTLREKAPYDISREDDDILLDFERKIEEVIAEEIVADVIEEETELLVADTSTVAVDVEKKTLPAKSSEKIIEEERKRYTGQKVTLNFQNADLKYLLTNLGEMQDMNVIVDEAVKGKVTLNLREVPLDQALDIIMRTNALAKEQEGNIIRFTLKSKLDKERQASLAAKKAESKLEDLVVEIVPVSHAPVSAMAAKVKDALTDRGKVTTDERTSVLIIKDIKSSIIEAKKLIKQLDIPTPQVLIEARIVEVDTNYTKDLGVQWGSRHSASAATGNPLGYNFPNSMDLGIGGGGSFALNAPAAGGTGTGSGGGAGGALGVSFGSIANTFSLDLKLSALESRGVSKIISRPRIVTLNKHEASIQQGFSLPFETTSAEGTQTQFIDANLNLTVTPEVKQDETIILSIKAAKNEPDFARTGSGGAPSISKKEASTVVLLKNGDTTVIGGIYTQKKGNSVTGTPFLSKLPLIGWLFRSKSKTDDKAELLIFITARILKNI